MNKLHHHRAQFPALSNKIYFNYGGQGPMPQGAMDAIAQSQAHIQHLGPFGNAAYGWISPQIQASREAIASTLNIPSNTITLTGNVTIGCNIAMWGIDWQPGDHLLLSDCEHPGVIATAQEIARRLAIEVTTCPLMATLNEGNPISIIAENLRPRTRLVVLSHVLWNTGQVLPIDKIVELCRSNNSLLLIDAAQSVGVLPVDLTALGVDFYAFTGHKWLCGPAGVGGLYVRPETRENLHPTFIGLNGVTTNSQAQPTGWQPDGRRYEVSTLSTPLYIGLKAAITIHEQWGTAEKRYEQICKNSQYLWQKLTSLSNVKCLKNSPPESGLVSFQLTNQTSIKLVQYLESQQILTRTISQPNCIRISVHYLTLESEIDELITAVSNFREMGD
ncbi:aminotransferase class V-fold PLP-dependent enzyme [Aphanizomenon flos-aquae NRERC-008]|uniref:Aminotransferase class V-fold PLP-dependent enzyme n=1 Tax=Aphanizomenon flos-aquae FACHB-1249 TaxID=2692889 RepID=A0ABR8IUS8_APHFL|nr:MULTISPECIES: aminotransferase class V-fold PLP-dependent enzyme [Aphanizomenon]MBD2391351.1 aminotransferase class V-fold PLP-dependent enzyme [Aphanizomenon flos-aquae FACHB-1171]MBD2557260.1 aminotransferase class V-fold PLP-dependent enzyme [Aphanizomenon flos-aquae FACHB-1290]MBD2632512.1 aminotransferase class V-fold PLP-dependent enzyme [Aphanizomenon sp. FACHB-1399]MBD2643414.1 aminotransferase class V-fold PLP-dependent enzyme [Aphanizomenon sp. FACHB-1401]MBD2656563.1 aminotransfe